MIADNYSGLNALPRFPMSETRTFPVYHCPVGLLQGFVFFQQKRFAFRRTAVLHITGAVKQRQTL